MHHHSSRHLVHGFVFGFIICAGATFSLSAIAEQPTASHPLWVMTFNIRYNNPNDGPNAWPNRKDLVPSVIRFHRADVVGLQEALIGQLRDLDERLPGFDRVGVGRDDGKEAGEFAAILFRKDRLEVLDSGTFWYSDTPDEASQGWDNNRRVCTWAHFRDRSASNDTSDGGFWLFNTHFGFTREHRQKTPPLLRKRIADIAGDGPVVLMGDFNMRAGSNQYHAVMKGSGDDGVVQFRDAFEVSKTPHHGPTGSFTGFNKLPEADTRIDFIFVSANVSVLSHGILADVFDGNRFPSDHLPVLAELRFE